MPSAERLPGKEHIPRYPPGWIVLRILQLIIALACLGLSAYGIVIRAYASAGLMIFSAISTLILSVWLVSAHSCAPRLFNYWAVLMFDIFLYIFWLCAFSLMAVAAATRLGGTSYNDLYDGDLYDFDYDDYSDLYNDLDGVDWKTYHTTYGAILAAGSGLGAIEFLLYFIALVTDAVVIFRHRRAGLHSRPVTTSAAPFQMQTQPSTNYYAVPQQGIPFNQQETVYNPQQMYSQPMQVQQPQPQQNLQPMYYQQPQQQPIAPQHTGGSYIQQKPVSPAPYHQ